MFLPLVRPQLIALDMDGTICDSTNTIPPENFAALSTCRAAGVHIAVLTGRRRSTLAPLLEQLYRECEPRSGGHRTAAVEIASDGGAVAAAIPNWLVATNSGGLVWDYPGWRQRAVQTMPPDLANQVLDVLAPHSLNCYVNPANSSDIELVHLRREPSVEFDAYFARFGQGARHVTTAAELLAHEITQFAIPAADTVVYELAARLRQHFPPAELSVLTMRWPLLDMRALEAYSPQCNKANALAAIAAQLDIKQSRVAAAGDDQNDVPMLAWAGHSAVMPHTPDDVAAAAQQRLPGSGVASLAPWLRALAELPQD